MKRLRLCLKSMIMPSNVAVRAEWWQNSPKPLSHKLDDILQRLLQVMSAALSHRPLSQCFLGTVHIQITYTLSQQDLTTRWHSDPRKTGEILLWHLHIQANRGLGRGANENISSRAFTHWRENKLPTVSDVNWEEQVLIISLAPILVFFWWRASFIALLLVCVGCLVPPPSLLRQRH